MSAGIDVVHKRKIDYLEIYNSSLNALFQLKFHRSKEDILRISNNKSIFAEKKIINIKIKSREDNCKKKIMTQI